MSETSVLSGQSLLDAEAAFLIALAESGIPVDVQELITLGSLQGNIAPGALRRAIIAAVGAIKRQPDQTIGLNWSLSDETRRRLDEIEKFTVRAGDPRLNTIICGVKND